METAKLSPIEIAALVVQKRGYLIVCVEDVQPLGSVRRDTTQAGEHLGQPLRFVRETTAEDFNGQIELLRPFFGYDAPSAPSWFHFYIVETD